jgi:hypothetical protein
MPVNYLTFINNLLKSVEVVNIFTRLKMIQSYLDKFNDEYF